jgi:sialic acid synthase SpsE
MKKSFFIEGKEIGGNSNKCYTIAEIASNHNRDKNTVRKLIDASVDAGFDAVKFQIYDAEEAFSKNVTTDDVNYAHFYGSKPWWEVARDKILMPREWFKDFFTYARERKITPLCTVHREEDAEFLTNIGLDAFKIASIDLHYHFLLEKLCKFKKPIILSTGMAHLKEIEESVNFLKQNNCSELMLLHCVSCYPPQTKNNNLNNIKMFREKFNLPVGFSDHSSGLICGAISVALGAKLIEKHITLDKSFKGPDHPFSIEPHEMKEFISLIRETEESLGSIDRIISEQELESRKAVRRSIVTKTHIKKGEKITLEKIKFARPGTGIPPNQFKNIQGCESKTDIAPETIIKFEMFK